MLNLNTVTAVYIDGRPNSTSRLKLFQIMKALKSKIKFNNVKYFVYDDISTEGLAQKIKINSITTTGEYSGFVMRELPEYIDDKHIMIIHPDGFPINLHLWSDEFLKYDYLGAAWGSWVGYTPMHYAMGWMEGGNGGFNIRSKKLMDLCKTVQIDHEIKANFQEDGFICGHLRPWLKQNGCKFAPYEIQKLWALETPLDDHHNDVNQTFGFHAHHFIKYEEALDMLIN